MALKTVFVSGNMSDIVPDGTDYVTQIQKYSIRTDRFKRPIHPGRFPFGCSRSHIAQFHSNGLQFCFC